MTEKTKPAGESFDSGTFRGLELSEVKSQVMDEIRKWEIKRINALITADVNEEMAKMLKSQANASNKPDQGKLAKVRSLEAQVRDLRAQAQAWQDAVEKLATKYADVLDAHSSGSLGGEG